MPKRFLQILLFALALPMATDCAVGQRPDAWISRFTAKHVTGDGVGYEDGFTSLEWFLPLDQDSVQEMWFGDFRGIAFNDAEFGGNAGMGMRWYVPSQDRIYGFNGYWDFRNEESLLFNQIGLGLESLGPIFDFRVNGYTPTVNDASQRLPFTFVGNGLQVNEIHGLTGLDYEVAANLPPMGPFGARIAGGGYFFDSSNTDEAAGWRARAEVAFRDEFGVSFVAQEDDVFGSTWNLILEWRPKVEHFDALARRSMRHRFRNDEGHGDGSTVLHRLADPVYRQQNIVLLKTTAPVNGTGGTPLVFAHAVPGAAGTGTFEDPYGSLAMAAADPLAANNIVYTPSGGPFTENVTLQNGTQLLSNGPVQNVATSLGNIALPFSGTGVNTAVNGTLTVADNTTVNGFDITGSLTGTGITTTNITQTSVTGTVGDAISFLNSTGVSLNTVTAAAPAGNGIMLTGSEATLTGVTVNNAGMAGIVLNDSNATISGSNVSNTGDDGVQIDTAATDRTITLSSTTITNAGNEGIDANAAGAGNLTLASTGTSVTSTDNAIDISKTAGGNAVVSLTNTTLQSTAGTGLNADGSAGAGTLFVSTLSNTTVNGAATGGLIFNTVTFDADSAAAGVQPVMSTATTVGSTGTRATGPGVSLTDVTGNWNAGNLMIFNQNGTGLFIDNSTLGTPVVISSSAGSVVNTQTGPVLELNTATSGLVFDSLTSTNSPSRAFGANNVTGSVTSGGSVFSGSVLPSIRYEAIALPDMFTANLGTTTINSTINNVPADNIEKVGVTDGLTETYTPLTVNGP